MKTGCFANVDLIIWLLILEKLNQSPSKIIRFDNILSEKCNMNANVYFMICPNVPG